MFGQHAACNCRAAFEGRYGFLSARTSLGAHAVLATNLRHQISRLGVKRKIRPLNHVAACLATHEGAGHALQLLDGVCFLKQNADDLNFTEFCASEYINYLFAFLPNGLLSCTTRHPFLAATNSILHTGPILSNVLALVTGFGLGGIFIGLNISAQQTKRTTQASTRQALAKISALDEAEIQELFGELPSWLAFEDFERGGWINKVVSAAWPYLDEATSSLIVGALDPILQATRPNFLTTLQFERFSFGSVPARIEAVKVYESTGDAVEIDLQVFWAGDPRVVLAVRAAQDTLAVPVSLTEIQCKFTLRLIFAPLIGKFPCFGALTVTLTEEPELDFDLRVVGGDITLVPGLAQPLRTYINALISSYLVWPRCITIPIPGTGYSLPAAVQDDRAGLLHIEALSHDDLANSPGELGLEICWPGTDVVDEERVRALAGGMMLSSRPISLLVNDPCRQVLRLRWYSSNSESTSGVNELILQSESTVILEDLVRLSFLNEPVNEDSTDSWGPVTVAVEFDAVDQKSKINLVRKSDQKTNLSKRSSSSFMSDVWRSFNKRIFGTSNEERSEDVNLLSMNNEAGKELELEVSRRLGAKMVQVTLRYQALTYLSGRSQDGSTVKQNVPSKTFFDGHHASAVCNAKTTLPISQGPPEYKDIAHRDSETRLYDSSAADFLTEVKPGSSTN